VAEVRAVFTTCLVIVVVGLSYVVTVGVLHR
jgi:hypothetical protein